MCSAGVALADNVLALDVVASLVRMSGGLSPALKLLAQIKRTLKVAGLPVVTKDRSHRGSRQPRHRPK